MRARTLVKVLAAAVPLSIGSLALARMVRFNPSAPVFEMIGRPVGGATPGGATAAYLAGARIAALDDGALVIDADSGALLKTDRAGKAVGQLAIGRDAGLLAYDRDAKLAYVADRRGDKVVVVDVDKLVATRTIATPVEPFGIALSPDRKTVYVSTIADRTFVAYDAQTGKERWRTATAREPRGIAVAPDGSRALVAYVATGTIDQIDLADAAHRPEHVALSTAPSSRNRFRGDAGDSFARASFAITFMGANQAVTAFQRETPVQIANGSERTGSYGGGFEPPISHELAFFGFGKSDRVAQATAAIAQHQPHALAWDAAHDTLYVAGLGNDTILQVRDASQATIQMGQSVQLAGKAKCGPDGLAVTGAGDVLVWCSFSRTVERLAAVDAKGALAAQLAPPAEGPTLIASAYTDKQHQGLELFHLAEAQVSTAGAMACASCHPDGRADGLSWRIDKHELQTPLLAGRLVGTHPFKWDGGDPTLRDSLTSTMKRLGGTGLQPGETDALAAYLESVPSVRTPTRDAQQVARGKALFDGELGCRQCHDGASYTDQEKHKLAGTLAESDTPSLKGLAASAPYYHDGSAATLEALLRDRGAVHGMTESTKLDDKQVADLTAFLETL